MRRWDVLCVKVQLCNMKKIFCVLVAAAVLLSVCHASPEPANSNSTARVKAILSYFHTLEPRTEKRLLSGQFSNFGRGANLQLTDQIHQITGRQPAMLGVDYADFSRGGLGITFEAPNQAAIEYWKKGGLVHVSAHLYNPVRTNGGGLRDRGVELASLLNPDSETHNRWMKELDQLAAGLQQLKEADVVVLWRPFHEMNGDWFWWGDHDPETFIKVWRHMFHYFTTTKNLDNLLWIYGPNHGAKTAAYYPGDGYADLIGLDAYTDFIDPEHIKGYDEIAKIKKPFGFTEYGPHGAQNPPGDYDYMRFLQGVQKHFPRTVFFMSWNAKWSLAQNTNITAMLNHPWIVNREDLPPGLVGSR
jgi:mannan endo-1,4-beta-mannosidase